MVIELSDLQIEKVQKEVVSLLHGHSLSLAKQENLVVVVFVNKEQELLVLDMNSKNKEVRKMVKLRLTGKKITSHQKGRVYSYLCPLKLKASI